MEWLVCSVESAFKSHLRHQPPFDSQGSEPPQTGIVLVLLLTAATFLFWVGLEPRQEPPLLI